MKLIEHSNLLGYVVAVNYERGIVMYFTANATFSDEIIATLRLQFYGWGILLCDEPNKAKAIAHNDEVSHAIDSVAAENI